MSKISWPVALVVVLVLVLVLAPSSKAAPPAVIDRSYDQAVRDAALNLPGARPGPGGSADGLVGACHQTFVKASGAVATEYGAPSSTGNVGAKLNPYYYGCDAGGLVVKGAQAVGHFFGRLF